MKKFGYLGAAVLALSACSESISDPTTSAFSQPNAVGTIQNTDAARLAGSDSSGVTGNVYGYEAGSIDGEVFAAFSGVAAGASVTPPPASGPATYTGTFEVGVVGSIFDTGSGYSGSVTTDNGSITLNADFDAGTLTGSGTGVNDFTNFVLNGNELEVNGTITGTQLRGTATYDGVSGPLNGLIGSDEVIGVFHGNSDSQTHAGGFIAN